MTNYMFYCSNCNSTWSGLKENPNEITYCPDCHILMQPLLITSDEWKGGNRN